MRYLPTGHITNAKGIRRLAAASVFLIMSSHVALNAQSEPDSVATELQEVTVTSPTKRLARIKGGDVTLGSDAAGALPSVTGSRDAMRIMQSLPGVSSNSDLTGGLFVQGCDNSANLMTIGGHRVVNPMHILGIFPTFNNAHFRTFSLQTIGTGNSPAGFSGAWIESTPDRRIPEHAVGEATVGLIESGGALRIPVMDGRGMIGVAARGSYTGLLFGSALKLNHSRLGYTNSDLNVSFMKLMGRRTRLTLDLYGSNDRVRLSDDNYASSNSLRWNNVMAGAELTDSVMTHRITVSAYENRFILSEAGKEARVPSGYAFGSYSGEVNKNGWRIGMGAAMHNCELNGRDSIGNGIELNAHASYEWNPRRNIRVTPGVVLWHYRSGLDRTEGDRISMVRPLPRLRVDWTPLPGMAVTAKYASLTQATLQIQETTSGLPLDVWIGADGHIKPIEGNAVSLSLSYAWRGLDFSAEGYWRRIRRQPEYDGAVLNLLNPAYSPLSDVRESNGNAWGLSLMAMRSFGNVRGWITYNLGFSRFRFADDPSFTFPSSHDRRHDLKANVAWQPAARFTFGASWTWATGYPYTRASFGYMIGENLICEYLPHNSSRMPAYMRLDLSARVLIGETARIRQELSLSLYNALCHRNVLFISTSYSPDDGIHTKESSMRAIIPSLSYTITLK